MTEPTHTRKLAAILAADVAGYSRLMRDDDQATVALLDECRIAFRGWIEAHAGRVVDMAGDSVLAVFETATGAVQCAVDIQKDLESRNASLPGERRMLFRIGVNLGEVITKTDGSVYGDGVNIAARLQSIGEPGGLCVSGSVYEQVRGRIGIGFEFIGEQRVKNIAEPVRAYRLMTLEQSSKRKNVPSRNLTLGLIVTAVVVAVAGVLLWKYVEGFRSKEPPGQPVQTVAKAVPRVAVLPLANFSANEKDEYFSDGMTEELISKLSRVNGMDVIARTSVMQYKGTRKSIAEIGRELNVGAVLEGSVRKAGRKIRITVQLIDSSTQAHLWSEDFDRDFKDVFVTQSEIAERVAGAMHVKLVGNGFGTNLHRTDIDTDTYVLYLKGRFQSAKMTPDSLAKSIEYFKQALKKSPEDARSLAGLAQAYSMLGWWGYAAPSDSFQKARLSAERAIAIDDTVSEAHVALGIVRFLFDWDWPGAERSYLRAIELSPGSSDAHLFHGILFKALGVREKAASENRRANELDPLNLMANAEIGWGAYYGGNLDEAARNCRRTLEMDPNYVFALSCLQMSLGMKKNPEAIDLGKKLLELTSGDAYFLGQLGWVHGLLGNRDEAQRILRKLREMPASQAAPPGAFLYVYLGLGDRDHAMDWLEKEYEGRWSDVPWIKTGPEFDWLRDDPRFKALLKKLKLDG